MPATVPRIGRPRPRGGLAKGLLGLIACLSATIATADDHPVETRLLETAAGNPPTADVIGGSLDSRFKPFSYREARRHPGGFWLKLQTAADPTADGAPVLTVDKGRHLQMQVLTPSSGHSLILPPALELAEFRGLHRVAYLLPAGLAQSATLYAHIEPNGRGAEELRFATSTLNEQVARGTEHARMIALTFGALMALAVTALLIWFILSDRLFVLYGTMIFLQALYVAYLSGQGFDWPLLSYGRPLTSHAWNVPIALSGAFACLFVREIADLRKYWPRVYVIFRWLAVAFLLLAFANIGSLFGLGGLIAAIGNILFLGSALFTIIVSFLAWRRGSRAAGWFLIAWTQLEVFTIATAARMLLTDGDDSNFLLYYGLPLSMVAAAVLIALGVADRMREHRAALSEAERRAQTDPLTGVLNRRSLIERLNAACARAQTRGLPIAVLFIDLDHFKQINDTCGHDAGDACLRAVIGPIQTELRQSDVVGRYGGEEFVVILSSADEAAAHPIAERICRRVGEIAIDGFGHPIRVTCSIGVAASDRLGVWGEQLITHADGAVYAAKRSGRNRVWVAQAQAA